MKSSGKKYISLPILFFVLAVALSLTIWRDVSWAAKIAFYAFGLATGLLASRGS
jgi:hypothetical protein